MLFASYQNNYNKSLTASETSVRTVGSTALRAGCFGSPALTPPVAVMPLLHWNCHMRTSPSSSVPTRTR